MKLAVVTGAASGIGRALASELCTRGVRVVLADIDPEVEAVADELGSRATAHVVDVTDSDAMAQLGRQAADGGGVDLWINNAGIAVGGEVLDLSADDWQQVIGVNVMGVVHGVRAIYPDMVRRGRGHIVNVASVAGLSPFPLAIPYTASKHAVVGLSLALRSEAAAYGVRVSVACPGAIQTPIWQRSRMVGAAAGGAERELAGRWERFTSPEACARAVVKGVRKNRAVIPVTAEAHGLWALARLSPTLAVHFHRRVVKSVRKMAGTA